MRLYGNNVSRGEHRVSERDDIRIKGHQPSLNERTKNLIIPDDVSATFPAANSTEQENWTVKIFSSSHAVSQMSLLLFLFTSYANSFTTNISYYNISSFINLN